MTTTVQGSRLLVKLGYRLGDPCGMVGWAARTTWRFGHRLDQESLYALVSGQQSADTGARPVHESSSLLKEPIQLGEHLDDDGPARAIPA